MHRLIPRESLTLALSDSITPGPEPGVGICLQIIFKANNSEVVPALSLNLGGALSWRLWGFSCFCIRNTDG
jgi:hypothetical protein